MCTSRLHIVRFAILGWHFQVNKAPFLAHWRICHDANQLSVVSQIAESSSISVSACINGVASSDLIIYKFTKFYDGDSAQRQCWSCARSRCCPWPMQSTFGHKPTGTISLRPAVDPTMSHTRHRSSDFQITRVIVKKDNIAVKRKWCYAVRYEILVWWPREYFFQVTYRYNYFTNSSCLNIYQDSEMMILVFFTTYRFYPNDYGRKHIKNLISQRFLCSILNVCAFIFFLVLPFLIFIRIIIV